MLICYVFPLLDSPVASDRQFELTLHHHTHMYAPLRTARENRGTSSGLLLLLFNSTLQNSPLSHHPGLFCRIDTQFSGGTKHQRLHTCSPLPVTAQSIDHPSGYPIIEMNAISCLPRAVAKPPGPGYEGSQSYGSESSLDICTRFYPASFSPDSCIRGKETS